MLKRGLSQPGRIARQAALCSAFALLTACGGDFFKKPDGTVGSSSTPSNPSTSSSGQESSSSAVSSSVPVPSSSLSSSSQGNVGDGFKLTIQSEDFNRFSDTTDAQEGTCGDGPVDMGAAKPGEPGNCDVGWTNAGEWLDFDFNMPESGTFTIALGLGSDLADRSVEILVNGQSVGSLDVPQIGWEAFEEVAMTDIDIDAGATTLRVLFTTGATNFDYVRLEQTDFVAEPSSSSSMSSSSSSVTPIEDDDNDGVANDVDACPDTQGTTLYHLVDGRTVFYGATALFDSPSRGDLYRHIIYVSDGSSEGNFVEDEARYNTGLVPGVSIGSDAEIQITVAGSGMGWYCEVGADCQYERADYYTLLVDEFGDPIGDASYLVESAEFDFMPPAGSGYVDPQGCSAGQLDKDEDGVANDVDICPNTPDGETVVKDGCALFELDSDFDGVDDSVDQCPLTISGDVDDQGCAESQKDSDDDGITDDLDQCPSTDADATVDAVGCADNQLDGDNDGVNNTEDACPNTPANEDVDTAGCAESQKDDDSDGVTNNLDNCPSTPETEQADAEGCSDSQKDSDNDGVVDSIDQCPNTSADDVVNDDGCGLLQTDGDSDGVENDLDQCPNTPTGEDVDSEGCSESQKDDDSDGVMNNADQCPATGAGLGVDADGCADNQKDSDADGVADDADQCPATTSGETVDANGCSEAQKDGDDDGVSDASDSCPATPANEPVDTAGCSDSQKDTDQDGVTDNVDQCPGTPSGETVDSQGCGPTQTDGDDDGVSNAQDQCPNTPANEDPDANGCSESQKDDDTDGVMNNVDQCPATPAGEEVDANGCADSQKDGDNDGVSDDADQCPATPGNENADASGCSESQKDDDSDGVMNNADLCPATPAGADVDASGCADSQKDGDNDGVTDDADQCPATPGDENADASGCSESQKDDDADGVMNNLDQCPASPAGADVDTNGCADSEKDSDNDGVADDVDQCPTTPGDEVAGADGCSDSQKDSDGDGVSDAVDQCPNTGSGADVDVQGCSDSQKDGDEDGVSDAADLCPGTPGNELADANGCSDSQKDSDNDGVSDALDLCPGSSGPVNSAGCSADQRDSDADGVSDANDQCDNTPSTETAGAEGCSVSQIDAAGLYAGTCAACHGPQGEGASQAAVFGKTADDLRNIIANGTLMPNVAGDLTDTEIEALGLLMSGFPVPDADGDGVVDADDTCDNTPNSEAAGPDGCSVSQIDAAALFDSTCKNCHGPQGEGGAYAAVYGKSADDLRYIIANGTLMPNIAGDLTDPQIDALGAFMTALPVPDSDGDGVNDANDLCPDSEAGLSKDSDGCTANQILGDPVSGQQAWTSSGCAGCHGNFANQAGVTRAIDPNNLTATDATSIAGFIELNMQYIGACTGQCAADAAAFVLTLEPEPAPDIDAQAIYTADCSSCHGAQGQGLGTVFPSVQGATAADLRDAIQNGTTMPGIAANGGYTEAEIDALGAYMSTLP